MPFKLEQIEKGDEVGGDRGEERDITLLCVAPLALDVVVAVTVEDVLAVALAEELPELMARLKLVLCEKA